MPRTARFPAAFVLLLVLATIAPGTTPAAAAAPAPSSGDPFGRHHLSLLGGYARYLDPVVDPVLVGPESRVTSANLADAVDAGIRYRISLRPGVDLAFEAHRVEARGTTTIHDLLSGTRSSLDRGVRSEWWGMGLRRTLIAPAFRPFLQASLVRARESTLRGPVRTGESGPEGYEWDGLGSEWGVAFAAGGEVPLGRSLSVPIELAWMHARPYDDVWNLGLRTGVTWHPGR